MVCQCKIKTKISHCNLYDIYIYTCDMSVCMYMYVWVCPYSLLFLSSLAQLPDVSHFGSVAHQRAIFHHCWFIATALGTPSALPMRQAVPQQQEEGGFTLEGFQVGTIDASEIQVSPVGGW